MKVFVTGGAGYIGSVVTSQLIKQGNEVVVFDNLFQGHREAVHPDAVFILGDLADKSALDAAFAEHKPDAVMHFASYTLVGESMEDPFLYLRDNITNGCNLFESAVSHNVKRFILSSTANLFDDPEVIPIAETERVVPGSPYGESKHMLENILSWMERIYDIRFACLRYFNACGAAHEDLGEDHAPETHLIPLILEVALGQREDIKIYGDDYPTPDGTCIRDYIHVLDLADAHIRALNDLHNGSRKYNLGTGTGFSVKQVVEMCREVTGHPIPAQITPRRAGDPAILVASSETINEELSWAPSHSSLHNIIATAWAWHQKHPHGYDTE